MHDWGWNNPCRGWCFFLKEALRHASLNNAKHSFSFSQTSLAVKLLDKLAGLALVSHLCKAAILARYKKSFRFFLSHRKQTSLFWTWIFNWRNNSGIKRFLDSFRRSKCWWMLFGDGKQRLQLLPVYFALIFSRLLHFLQLTVLPDSSKQYA